MQHFICKKSIFLSTSGQKWFISGFVSKKTNITFISVIEVRTAFTPNLKLFLKKKFPPVPVAFFPPVLPSTDNFLRMA